MRVLLAIDGSPCSDAAVNEVASRVWPDDTEVRVLAVYELPLAPAPEIWSLPPDYFEKLDQAAREHAQAVEQSVVLKLALSLASTVKVTGNILPGSPREVILEEAERWEADLIVMGSHGYGLWDRFLLGSVSQAVVSHAKCSVEVVRSREQRIAAVKAA